MEPNLYIEEAYCDGDIWNYRIGFSVQHEPPQPPAPWFTVKWAIHETIDKIRRKYPNAEIFVCLTDTKNNYRLDLARTRKYKGGRNAPKPYYWRKIRAYFESLGNVIVSVNEEADDVMSKAIIRNPKAVCVSEDKDLKNTPGVHYNDKTGREVVINDPQAYRNFYTQLLTGDNVDNIPGCPGIGKGKAVQLLQSCRTPEEFEKAIGLAYACAKGWKDQITGEWIDNTDPEAFMIEQGRLLWMRRQDDEMWDLRANGFTTL